VTVPSLKLYAAKSEGEVRRSRKNLAAASVHASSSSQSRSINKNVALKKDKCVASFPTPLESIDTTNVVESSTKTKKTKAAALAGSSIATGLRVSASIECSDQSTSPSQRSEDDENIPMFLKIQKLNKEQKEKTVPTWLSGANNIAESSALEESVGDEDLLENWNKPKDLPTILDDNKSDVK